MQIGESKQKARKKSPLLLTCFLVALFSGATVPGQELTFQAYVDKTAVTTGDLVQLTLEVSGPDIPPVQDIPLPPLHNLREVSRSSSSSQNISIINGKVATTKTQSIILVLSPVKPGKARIGEAVLKFKGKTYRTEAIDITVSSSGKPSPQGAKGPAPAAGSPGQGDRMIILSAVPTKKTVFVNEPVVVDFTLYTRARIEGLEISQQPETTGFLTEDVALPQRLQTFTQVLNGRRYTAAVVRRLVLFPKIPGDKTIGALKLRCSVRVRGGNPFFRDFFSDSFFGRVVTREVASRPVSIQVKPLPREGRPGNFKGDVGHYTISLVIDSTRVAAGEAVALTVKISGKGNIKSLSEPELKLPDDFRRYQPEVDTRSTVKGGGISGYKSFKYLLVPRNPGEYRVGPAVFSFFDTESNRYRTIRAEARTIRVTPGTALLAGTSGPAMTKRKVRLLKQEIRYIKEPAGVLKTVKSPWELPTFWLALFLPGLSFLASSLYQRHRLRLARDIGYARNRQALNSARRLLAEARSNMKAGDSKAFHSAASRAIRNFIGDKFNLPSPTLTATKIEELLLSRNIDGDLSGELKGLLDELDLAQYAPVAVSPGEMDSRLKRTERLLNALARKL